MPLFRYTLAGETRECAFSFRHLMLAEMRVVQRATQLRPGDFVTALTEGDPEALTALVVLMEKRQGRVVRFEDVDIDLGAFEAEPLDEERGDDEGDEGGDPKDHDPAEGDQPRSRRGRSTKAG